MIDQATLTLPPTDVDGDGVDETGVFEFVGDLTVTLSQVPNYLIETAGTASQVSAAVDEVFGDVAGLGDTRRKTFAVDAGAGSHRIEIDAVGYTGSDGQWGNTGDPTSTTAADATGADAATQLVVLDKYLATATVDSRTPATLEVGEYSTGGLYDPLDVLVQEPNGVFNAERSVSTVDLSLVCVETLDLATAIDATAREAF